MRYSDRPAPPDDTWCDRRQRPPRTPAVTVEVPCGSARHRVRWEDGRVTFLDHPVGGLKFEIALDKNKLSRCAKLLQALKRREIRFSGLPVIPTEIRTAIANHHHNTRLVGHGDRNTPATTSVQREICEQKMQVLTKPIVAAFAAQNLTVAASLDLTAFAGAHRFVVHIKASYNATLLTYDVTTRAWLMEDAGHLETIAQKVTDLFGKHGEHCRVCGFMPSAWSGRYEQQARFRSHVHTKRHIRAILTAIDAARRACGLLPPLPEPSEIPAAAPPLSPPKARSPRRPRTPARQIGLPLPQFL